MGDLTSPFRPAGYLVNERLTHEAQNQEFLSMKNLVTAVVAAALLAMPAAGSAQAFKVERSGAGRPMILNEAAVKQRLSRARTRLRTALAEHIEATAPKAAFTAAVLGAITLAAPISASATGLALSKAHAAGKAGAIIGGAGLWGAIIGLIGGWGGVLIGSRQLLQLARDEEERRGVMQMSVVSLLVTTAFAAAMIIKPHPWTATIGFALMLLAFGIIHFAWLPRITARREAAELAEDPIGAADEHRKRRFYARLGMAIGTLCGASAVVAVWVISAN